MCSCVVLEGPAEEFAQQNFSKVQRTRTPSRQTSFLGRTVKYFFGPLVVSKKFVETLQSPFSQLKEAVARLGVLRLDY